MIVGKAGLPPSGKLPLGEFTLVEEDSLGVAHRGDNMKFKVVENEENEKSVELRISESSKYPTIQVKTKTNGWQGILYFDGDTGRVGLHVLSPEQRDLGFETDERGFIKIY